MRKSYVNRKVLSIILCVALISVFSLTMAYAALNAILNISGNAEISASTWNVYLDNVNVSSGSVSGSSPTISNKTTVSFSTTLNRPGDFYEFTVDVKNGGTIDAMIDSVSKTSDLTADQLKYLNYIIEYQSGESINTKQLVLKKSYVRLKVRIEYRKDLVASDLPTTSSTLNLKFTVNYTQSDGNGSNILNNGRREITFVVQGTTYRALDGMKWQEWMGTSYNTAGFSSVHSSEINTSDGCRSLMDNGNFVGLTDIIKDGYEYRFQTAPC